MRIVFIGCVEFSKSTFEHLLKLSVEIVGVCTRESSKVNSDFVDLGLLSAEHNIPTHYTSEINSVETLSWIRKLSPDFIFCFGWSQLIKRDLLRLPKYGVIGYHPSLLPRNRGRNPIIWSLALGLNQTGSTFFFMDEGADSGDIISQREVEILSEDNATSLYQKITRTALEQLGELIPILGSELPRKPQDHTIANTWRKRSTRDGLIDWRMSARSIHNLVRSLAPPYKGAHFVCNGEEITVWRTSIAPESQENFEPGKVLRVLDSGLVVKCGEGSLVLELIEPSGWRPKGGYL